MSRCCHSDKSEICAASLFGSVYDDEVLNRSSLDLVCLGGIKKKKHDEKKRKTD